MFTGILFYLDIARKILFKKKMCHNQYMYFQVLIQNSSELTNVVPHKLVIIFVDFNERNIILEYEDIEVGDLRNQTTEKFKFLGCKFSQQ